ncbi:hypothetical protein [Rhizobium leguminosarum]|uniref:hypothetical protein n=1 Tax=Rhizobium leguminosarum TaxID=384 RepID=UPI00140F9CA8|nr:hypothetical protein [Rhizobium leguminosarum]QIO59219.1 hypothetical protein HA463_16540 [Rhizobium leguminosarum bv. trifolii]
MANTNVERKIHFARDFDERTLRNFESRLSGLGPGRFEITVTFKNGFSVTLTSVAELIALPMTDADPVKRVAINFSEDAGVARSNGRSPTSANVRMIDEIGYTVITYELRGDYGACVGLQHELDTIFRSTRAYARSVFHIHIIADLLFALAALPIVLFMYVLPKLGLNWPTDGFFVLQILCFAAYGILKTFAFPRLQLKWGYGAKAAAQRSLVVKVLAGFLIVGALSTIYQDVVLSWWKGTPKPPAQ